MIIPEFFERDLDDLTARVQRWTGDDQAVSFLFVADLHSHLVTTDSLFGQRRDSAGHIRLLNVAAMRLNVDFTANLGDVGLDVPLKEMSEKSEMTRRILQYHSECDRRPVLFCIGNHDISEKAEISAEYWGKAFFAMNRGCDMISAVSRTYGFYDVQGKQTRIFWLYTSDSEDYLSETQLEFLQHHLDDLPEGHCAAVLQHICPRAVGNWMGHDSVPQVAFARQHQILADFVRKGGKLAGDLCGHSHFDADEKAEGVHYFIFQGYGGIGPREMPPHARLAMQFNPRLNRTDTFDSSQYTLFHLAVIKPAQRQIRLFRLGPGGQACDRGAQF